MKPDDKEIYSEEEIAARMDGAMRTACAPDGRRL
jgi:hypothetical protein